MVHSFTYNCLSMHFPELDLNSRAIVLSIDRISQPWFCVAHTDPVELCSQSGNIATNHIYFLVHVVRKHAFAHNKRGNGNGFQTLLSPSCWRICPLCWKPPKQPPLQKEFLTTGWAPKCPLTNSGAHRVLRLSAFSRVCQPFPLTSGGLFENIW